MIVNDGYLILFYDVPMITQNEKRCYNRFREVLIKNGFYMFQESVYYKYIRELKYSNRFIDNIRLIAPDNSNVKGIFLTKKQFEDIEIIKGTKLKRLDSLVEEF